jgi:hypothetical protein
MNSLLEKYQPQIELFALNYCQVNGFLADKEPKDLTDADKDSVLYKRGLNLAICSFKYWSITLRALPHHCFVEKYREYRNDTMKLRTKVYLARLDELAAQL